MEGRLEHRDPPEYCIDVLRVLVRYRVLRAVGCQHCKRVGEVRTSSTTSAAMLLETWKLACGAIALLGPTRADHNYIQRSSRAVANIMHLSNLMSVSKKAVVKIIIGAIALYAIVAVLG